MRDCGLLSKSGRRLFSYSYCELNGLTGSSYRNTCSIGALKVRAILNARVSDGAYFPASMARMVWRVTPTRSANCSCVISPFSNRSRRMLFFRSLFRHFCPSSRTLRGSLSSAPGNSEHSPKYHCTQVLDGNSSLWPKHKKWYHCRRDK